MRVAALLPLACRSWIIVIQVLVFHFSFLTFCTRTATNRIMEFALSSRPSPPSSCDQVLSGLISLTTDISPGDLLVTYDAKKPLLRCHHLRLTRSHYNGYFTAATIQYLWTLQVKSEHFHDPNYLGWRFPTFALFCPPVRWGLLDSSSTSASSCNHATAAWRAGPQPRSCEISVPRRTSTAILWDQCSAPDLNRDPVTSVFRAGPQPWSCEISVPRRTSTAKSSAILWDQSFALDLSRDPVISTPPWLSCDAWVRRHSSTDSGRFSVLDTTRPRR